MFKPIDSKIWHTTQGYFMNISKTTRVSDCLISSKIWRIIPDNSGSEETWKEKTSNNATKSRRNMKSNKFELCFWLCGFDLEHGQFLVRPVAARMLFLVPRTVAFLPHSVKRQAQGLGVAAKVGGMSYEEKRQTARSPRSKVSKPQKIMSFASDSQTLLWHLCHLWSFGAENANSRSKSILFKIKKIKTHLTLINFPIPLSSWKWANQPIIPGLVSKLGCKQDVSARPCWHPVSHSKFGTQKMIRSGAKQLDQHMSEPMGWRHKEPTLQR